MKRYLNLIPWAVGVAGLVLRLWNLNQPLWYDESFTLLVAKLPPAQLLAATLADVHPPAYYLIISSLLAGLPWLPGAALLRYFSIACSLAALGLGWHLSGVLGLSRNARLAALGLLAINPSDIFYAQEGRMYALLGLLVLGQVYAMLKGKWWLLGGLTLLALYTHNYSLYYSAAIGLAGLGKYLHPMGTKGGTWSARLVTSPAARLVLAMLLPGLGWLPWGLGALVGQMGTVAQGYWIPSVTLGGSLLVLVQAWVGSWLPGPWPALAVPVLVAALLLLGAGGIKNKRYTLLLVGLLPAVLAISTSMAWKPVLLYRGLVPSLPFLAMLAGESFAGSRGAGRLARWLLVLPLVLGLGWQIGAGYALRVKSWVHWPASRVPAASLVVHLDDTSVVTWMANWPANHNVLLAAGCPGEGGALTAATRAALGIQTISIRNLPTHYYLVGVLHPLSTPCHAQTFTHLRMGAQTIAFTGQPFGEYSIWLK